MKKRYFIEHDDRKRIISKKEYNIIIQYYKITEKHKIGWNDEYIVGWERKYNDK